MRTHTGNPNIQITQYNRIETEFNRHVRRTVRFHFPSLSVFLPLDIFKDSAFAMWTATEREFIFCVIDGRYFPNLLRRAVSNWLPRSLAIMIHFYKYESNPHTRVTRSDGDSVFLVVSKRVKVVESIIFFFFFSHKLLCKSQRPNAKTQPI